MLTLQSLKKTDSYFFDKNKPKVIVTKSRKDVPPVSKATITKIKAALIGGDWVSFTDISKATGYVSGTVSRAAKYMVASGDAITKADEKGQARSNYLKLSKLV